MPLFSVIVPVYNAEKTLERCLSSLREQTEESFEVLLVENGSNDGSAGICREYAAADNRFHLITMQTNCGPSRARNAGLDAAVGEYVAFVDSDDYVVQDYLSSLRTEFQKGNPDAVFFGYHEISLDGQDRGLHVPKAERAGTRAEIWAQLSGQGLFGYTWIKALRREIIGDVRFPVDLNLFEDEVFTCWVLEKAKKIGVLSKPLYIYTTGNAASLVGKTHQDYPQKCDRVYRAWDELLGDHDRKKELLEEKANAAAFRCMYYCYERDVDVEAFVHALADSSFFAAHTNWTEFDLLVKERKLAAIRWKRAVYRTKNKIAGLIRR